MLIVSWRQTLVGLLILCVVMAGFPALAGPAWAADDDVVIDGGGWGHGIGMSQWGAKALADQGATAQEIIQHFYTGTAVEALLEVPDPVLLGIGQDMSVMNIEPVGGGVRLTLGEDSSLVARPGDGHTWALQAYPDGTCSYLMDGVEAGTRTSCDGTITWSPQPLVRVILTVRAKVSASSYTERILEVPRGLVQIKPAPGNTFHAVAELDLETYLYGLAEVPASWPEQALQAQAVAARSYSASVIEARDPVARADVCACHLYATYLDQQWSGWIAEDVRWVEAVDATAGKVAMYQGAVISAFYFSSSGGRTENKEDVWGGNPIPYLTSVEDPGASSWTKELTRPDFAAGLGFDHISSLHILARYDSGTPSDVAGTGTKFGISVTEHLTGSDLKARLGLRSHQVRTIDFCGPPLEGDSLVAYDPTGGLEAWWLTSSGFCVLPIGPVMEGADVVWTGYLGGRYESDVLLYDRQSGRFQFVELTSDASEANVILDTFGSTNWTSVVPGDFNGDGSVDLLFYRAADGLMRFYTVTETGRFVPISAVMYGTHNWTHLVPGDFDGDGRDDLLWYRASDGLMRFYSISDTGLFYPLSEAMYGTRNWSLIRSGDFDGNGSDDLLYYRSDGIARFYTVLPDASFVSISSVLSVSPGWEHIQTGFFDGVAGRDLAWYSSTGTLTSTGFSGGSLHSITAVQTVDGGRILATLPLPELVP